MPRLLRLLRNLEPEPGGPADGSLALWGKAHRVTRPLRSRPYAQPTAQKLQDLARSAGGKSGPSLVLIDVTGHVMPTAPTPAGAAPPPHLTKPRQFTRLPDVIGRFTQPYPQPLNLEVRLELGVAIHLQINNASSPFGAARYNGGRVSILVADAPADAPYAPNPPLTGHWCVESPDCVTPHLLRELARLASLPLEVGGVPPDRQRPMPTRLCDIPPSPWWDYSPQRRVLEASYAQSPLLVDDGEYANLVPRADPIAGELTPRGGQLSPRAEFRAANLKYALRVGRRLATWGLEGHQVQCTLVLADRADLIAGVTPPAGVALPPGVEGLSCVPCLDFVGESGLHLSNESLRGHTEMLQTGQITALVDRDNLEMVTAVSHVHAGDHYRGTACVRLAKAFKGYAISVRDHRVELYDGQRLALWHDGFEWRWNPFDTLQRRMQVFFGTGSGYLPGEVDTLARRVVGAISELLDLRASSIVAFIDPARHATLLAAQPAKARGRPLLGLPNVRPVLVPMRCHVESSLQPQRAARAPDQQASDYYPIKMPALQALVGLLKVDGVHIVSPNGAVTQLGYRITSEAGPGEDESAGGSARAAARLLSRDMGDLGVVVKVSASGHILMFENGRKVR